MAALSASHGHTVTGRVSTPFDRHQQVTPRAAVRVPPDALTESPQSLPSSILRHVIASDYDEASDNAMLSSSGNSQVPALEVRQSRRDADNELAQDSSEGSVDIITERQTVGHDDVKSASPRKPLPAHWLPWPGSSALPVAQHPAALNEEKSSSRPSPTDRNAVRATRSSHDISKSHVEGTFFLTKEALAAVDANLATPALRRSPSKVQSSPTKVPWNSPSVSPKARSLRYSLGSPSKMSPTQPTNLSKHVTAHGRRAPSSVASTGATSFYTARGSPVSPVCSQSGFLPCDESSKGDTSDYFDSFADVTFGQIDELNKGLKTEGTITAPGNRNETPRPRLPINTHPHDTAADSIGLHVSPQDTASQASDADAGRLGRPKIGRTESFHPLPSTTQSSRLPRLSMGKGSSAHAPTLSSTLKQTKSASQLRPSKMTQEKTESKRLAKPKPTEQKSARHVRTFDSKGSTPILSNRSSRDISATLSTGSLATVSTDHTMRTGDVGLLSSYLQDTAVKTSEMTEDLAFSSLSRVTSSSTVKATQTDDSFVLANKVNFGNMHSSDADDEYDESIVSATSAGHDQQVTEPTRGRSSNYTPSDRGTNTSEASKQSSAASQLRATAADFVPAPQNTVKDNTNSLDLPGLPNLYALDEYGVPWFYHMYPVPWLLPSVFMKGRSTSPRKSRPRKQRSTQYEIKHDTRPPTEHRRQASSAEASSTGAKVIFTATPAANLGKDNITSGMGSSAVGTGDARLSDSPFSVQLDMIARQAKLRTDTHTQHQPQGDLTSVRNVPVQDLRGGHTSPNRRRRMHRTDNGLYGGRGNIGVPLYATAPFPNPVPPMGRPTEDYGPTMGLKACGVIQIEKAHELIGGQVCHACTNSNR